MIIAVNFPIYAIGKKKPEKNQGFNGIRTCDLRDTGAMLYQLSYEATHWERGQLIEFISSREEWNDVEYIWNNSYLNCEFKYESFHIYSTLFIILHKVVFLELLSLRMKP